MMKFHRSIAMATVLTLICSTATLQADDGDCYRQSCYNKISPEWALGGLAVVAIIAVVLQKNSGGQIHAH